MYKEHFYTLALAQLLTFRDLEEKIVDTCPLTGGVHGFDPNRLVFWVCQ